MPDDCGLWALTAPPAPPSAPLSGRVTCDLAIVGAGFTGLSAALTAAEMGVDAVVVEAAQIGAGGSGRNVGLVNAGLWLMPQEVEDRLDAAGLAHDLPALLAQAPAAVWERIQRHAMACEAHPNGTLHCAPDDAGLAALRERRAQWAARGVDLDLLGPEETRLRTGTTRFTGALLDPRAGTIQPLAYARGLARAALDAGARIFTGSPVTQMSEGWTLTTPGGEIHARRLILAGNAYGQGPLAQNALSTLYYFNFATDPLPEDLRASVLPARQGVWDTAQVLTSVRLDNAGRVIIGSVGALGPETALHRGWAKRKLARLFPQLRGVELPHCWYGRIGTTGDALPRLWQPGPGAWGVMGYNGRGIAPGTVLGAALARAALGNDPAALPAMAAPGPDPLRAPRSAAIRAGAALWHGLDRG
jgi:glycine/D-amino acid oxidase-like deaminating enzyme